MKNPLKRLKKAIFKRLGGRREPLQADVGFYTELSVIWPDATWKMAGRDSHGQGFAKVDWDLLARSTILDSWARENYDAAVARAGYELNPGMFGAYPPPIPAGWRPSEAQMKKLFAKENWDVKVLHYMIGELEHLGHLRA